jgi:hypothetical protein
MRFRSIITAVNGTGHALRDKNGKEITVSSNDTMIINCPAKKEFCDPNLMILYPQIDYYYYKLEIYLYADVAELALVDGVKFTARSQNPKFTNFLLIFRYVWFAVSILGLFGYTWFYCRSGVRKMTFEHHYILILSISLVFFNDPIFGITLFYPSIATSIFSTVFVTQFVALLILFWIIMWRRMHLESVAMRTSQIGILQIFIAFLIFAMLSIATCVASVYSRLEPGVHANTSFFNQQSNTVQGLYLSGNYRGYPISYWNVLQ